MKIIVVLGILFVVPSGESNSSMNYCISHLFLTCSYICTHLLHIPVFSLEGEHGHVRGIAHLTSLDAIALYSSKGFNEGYDVKSALNDEECMKGHQAEALLPQKQPRDVSNKDVLEHHRLLRGHLSMSIGEFTAMSFDEYSNSTLISQAKSSKSKDPKASKKSKNSSAKSKSKKSKSSKSKTTKKQTKNSKKSKKAKGKETKEPKCKKNKKPKCKKDKCTVSTLSCNDGTWLCEHTPKTCKGGYTCKLDLMIASSVYHIM